LDKQNTKLQNNRHVQNISSALRRVHLIEDDQTILAGTDLVRAIKANIIDDIETKEKHAITIKQLTSILADRSVSRVEDAPPPRVEM